MLSPSMKQTLILIIVTLVAFVLWDTPFLYPLKLLVVFFHESSHALMTIITHGQVKEMVINLQQGGYVISSGGNRFLTLSAGYLGSLIWGISLYLIAAHTRIDKIIMALLALIILAITAVFIRDITTISFSLIMAVAMILCSIKASATVNDFILRLIGLTNMLYVPMDIYSDTIQRSHLRSDAYMLAEEIGGTTLLWGGIWLLLSTIAVMASLYISLKSSNSQVLPALNEKDAASDIIK